MMQLKLAVISLILTDAADGICLEPFHIFHSFAFFFKDRASGIETRMCSWKIDARARIWAIWCLQLTRSAQLEGSRYRMASESLFNKEASEIRGEIPLLILFNKELISDN